MTSIFELSDRLLSPPSSPITADPSAHMGDQRALEKLALELSMLDTGNIDSDLLNMPADGIVPGSTLNAFTSMLGFNGVHFDDRKKSQNMTECVPVPSSEHVAEIVGRQGKKMWFHFNLITILARITTHGV
jgi:hypothetical protein